MATASAGHGDLAVRCPSQGRPLIAQARIKEAFPAKTKRLFDRVAVRRLW